jgi:hypothetical protein
MPLLDDARQAMFALADLTEGFSSGSPPDPQSVLGLQSRLVRLYAQLGEEKTRKFSAKEAAYLNRKIQEATQYRHGRLDLKKKVADADRDALLAIAEESNAEIETAAEFDLYMTFLRSLERAIDHSRTVVSFLKSSEKNA